MIEEQIFDDAKEFAEELFSKDSSGHDIYHTIRVHDLSVAIQKKEGGDLGIIRLTALLHDVDDRKLFDTDGLSNAVRFMTDHGIPNDVQSAVCKNIPEISFKGRDSVSPSTLEGKIVQDADRLDAIGAIGIARAFAYGGSKGRAMHIPDESFKKDMSEEEYFRNQGTSLNHFYEKLFLLKDMMNTETGRNIAGSRHDYMKEFVEEFLSEWNGSK